MKKLWMSLFTSILLSSTLSHGIIYRVSRWKKEKTSLFGSAQDLNLLYDCHLDSPDKRATNKQYAEIAERENTAFRIVEDQTDEKAHYDQRVQNATQAYYAHDLGMSDMVRTDPASSDYLPSILVSPAYGLGTLNNTYNVDWRHAIGLGSNDKERTLFRRIFTKDMLTVMKEIMAYNDGPILHEYYRSIICNPDLSKLIKNGVVHSMEMDSAHVVNTTTPLMDARIMHTVYNAPDKPVIDIVAGGTHCENIEPVLEDLGYELIEDIYHPKTNTFEGTLIPIGIKKVLEKPLLA